MTSDHTTTERALIRLGNKVRAALSKFNDRNASVRVRHDNRVTEVLDTSPGQWVRANGERPNQHVNGPRVP